MPFGDYFNYLSTFATVTVLVALIILIPVGLFLCKYNLKFIAISVLGSVLTTVYFSQSMILLENYLQTNNHNTASVILGYAIPVVFFLAATFGIIRWGLQIWLSRTQNKAPSSLPVPLPGKITFTERRRKFLHWFTTRDGIGVCLIQAAVLAVHLIYIGQPASPAILDEGYYVPEAIRFLHGLHLNYPEHPPLGKWLIASGIFIFGDNPVGWRALSILFGVISIFLVYFIGKKLTAKWSHGGTFVPLLATFLMATENLTFLMGHVATLDVFYVTLMLLGFLLYLRGNYVWCGIAMGLSLLCKETAMLGIVVIILHWTITRRDELAAEIRNTWKALQGREMTGPLSSNILSMFKMLVMVAAVWLILIVPLEYSSMHLYPATTQWFNPLFRAIYMVWHPILQTFKVHEILGGGLLTPRAPWQWLLWPGAINVDNAPGANVTRYLVSIGWAVWPLIIPSIIYLIWESVKERAKGQNKAFFLLCWLVGIYGLLVVLQLITDRLTYEYYFYPAIPAVCLTIAWGIWRLWGVARKRFQTRVVFIAGLALYLLGTVVTFIIMSPLGTNLVKLPL